MDRLPRLPLLLLFVLVSAGLLAACGGGGGGTSSATPTTRYTLAVSVSGSGTVTSSPAGISCGSTCQAAFDSGTQVSLTATAASGWRFDSWSGACTGSGACSVRMDQARNVSARFVQAAPVRYTLSVSVSGSGSVGSSPAGISCSAQCTASFDSGTAVTLTATPGNGASFVGWAGDCAGTASTCTVTMTQARSVTASFAVAGAAVIDRVFAPNSFWYTPIPANAPLNPKSAAYTASLVHQIKTYYGNVNLNTYSYAAPIYFVQTSGTPVDGGPGSTPIFAVTTRTTVQAWDCQNRGWIDQGLAEQFKDVPIPAGAMPADGTDNEMAIYDVSTRRYWEFWVMRAENGGWKACWGGRINDTAANIGIFANPYGTTATGIPFIGGEISAEELARGEINHAMGISVVDAAIWYEFSWPATRSDGYNPNNDPDRIPEGIRFRLDPSINVDTLGLPPAGRAIARAAQVYGFVVWDKAGSVSMRMYNPKSYVLAGRTDPYPALFSGMASWDVLKNFPWDKVQFMPNDYGKP